MKTPWKLSIVGISFAICPILLFLLNLQRSNKHTPGMRSLPQFTGGHNCSHSNTIPAFMYEAIDQIVEKDQFELPDCRQTDMKKNLLFIKTHKCASDTLSAIFRRFALDHDLDVVLPVGGGFLLGWPHQMKPFMHRPPQPGRGFNILLDHSVYNKTYMSQLLPHDAVYMTSIREPGDRLTSALTYFAMANCGLMDRKLVESRDRIKITLEFLANMNHYDTVYKSVENLYSWEKCACIPNGMSMVRNAMAFDMGFPVGYHEGTVDEQHNYVFIIKWLRQIHQEFPIFILPQYFAESMVILKRYMCWPMKSILYKKLNDWKNPPNTNYPKEQMAAYQNWTNVDTLMYNMFQKLFKKRIQKFGKDFEQETAEYLSQLSKTSTYCKEKSHNTRNLTMAATPWNEEYVLTRQDCDHMNDQKHLRNTLKELYDKNPPDSYKHIEKEAMKSKYWWC